MLNCEQGKLTSASLKDIRRGHSLGMCDFLDSTTILYNIAYVFLDQYKEADDKVPQILKERDSARGWRF